MILANEIEILHIKILQIDGSIPRPRSAENFLFERNIIETSFWARFVLEVLDEFDFRKYNYSIEKFIPVKETTPGSDYPKKKSIKELLGIIIHFRMFNLTCYENGDYYLSVQSDLKSQCSFRFSDFLKSIKTFLLPKNLIILCICDKIESSGYTVFKENSTPINIFSVYQFDWLLKDSFRENIPLKLEIMKKNFNISNILDSCISELAFSPSAISYNNGKFSFNISFSPAWIKGQKQISDQFDGHLLFDLIRKSYENG